MMYGCDCLWNFLIQSTSVRSRFVRLLRRRDAKDRSSELDVEDDDDEEDVCMDGQFLSSAATICFTIRQPSYRSRSIFILSYPPPSSSSSSIDRSITAACEEDDEEEEEE